MSEDNKMGVIILAAVVAVIVFTGIMVRGCDDARQRSKMECIKAGRTGTECQQLFGP